MLLNQFGADMFSAPNRFSVDKCGAQKSLVQDSCVGGQIKNGGGDLLWFTQPSHRMQRGKLLPTFGAFFTCKTVNHVRCDSQVSFSRSMMTLSGFQ